MERRKQLYYRGITDSTKICNRGHKVEGNNVTETSARRGYSQCKACVRANATIQYHPDLEGYMDRIAEIHYTNILNANRRMTRGQILNMLD